MSKLKSINPYTNKLIRETGQLNEKELQIKIRDANTAFELWSKSTLDYRKQCINNVAEELKNNADELAKDITLEMGKPFKEAKAEIKKCAWVCEYYADHASEFLSTRIIKTDAQKSYVTYSPLGVILGVMPWNFPFWQVFRFAIPTLMAGNTALLKHASNVQICADNIEKTFLKAGLPEHVFQNLSISSSTVNQVLESEFVKGVSLTGSDGAGSKVAEQAGKLIKPSVLELGGSNSFIVLKDADIEKALDIGIQARMMNTGQSCIAAKRFIVDRQIAEEFVDGIKKRIEGLKIGDPLEGDTDIGPLATLDQAKLVKDQIDRSVKMGAKCLAGGSQDNCFIEPTLLINMKRTMPVFTEEVFGPVLSVMTFTDEEEAIEMSNDSQYGLGVTIMTEDIEKAQHMVPKIEDGAVFINSLVKSDPRLPFGGTKRSGYGRELSREGILEFVNAKTVFIAS